MLSLEVLLSVIAARNLTTLDGKMQKVCWWRGKKVIADSFLLAIQVEMVLCGTILLFMMVKSSLAKLQLASFLPYIYGTPGI
jgi:hypothetical protein